MSVAPPTVSKLLFGGVELANADTYAQHSVESGATLMLHSGTSLRVLLNHDFHDIPNEAVVWAEERVETMLARLGLGMARKWAVEGEWGTHFGGSGGDTTQSLQAWGVQDGTTLVPGTIKLTGSYKNHMFLLKNINGSNVF